MISAIKERPILMSGPMVRETLEDRKTKTRRVVTVPANVSLENASATSWDQRADDLRKEHGADDITIGYLLGQRTLGQDLMCNLINDVGIYAARCPYGQPGDRLYVRETWGTVRMHEMGQHVYGGRRIPDSDHIVYRAGRLVGIPPKEGRCTPDRFTTEWHDDIQPEKWRPSIHMPKWASRLTLEITDVRLERLQEITPADACDEGIARLAIQATVDAAHPLHRPMFDRGRWGPDGPENEQKYAGARECFAAFWDSLNAKRGYGWDVNPWVWVLTFKRLTP